MSSYYDDELDPYLTASVVMVGLVLVPLATLGLMSCTNVVRQRGDAARSGTPWLIAAFPFAFLGALLEVFLTGIFNILLTSRSYLLRTSSRELTNLAMASYRLPTVGWLFQRVADILVVIAIVEFCSGFLYALSGTKSKVRLSLRITAWVMGLILIVLAIAQLGVYNTALTGRLEGTIRSIEVSRMFRTSSQIAGAYDVLQFVISVCLLAYASVVVHKYRNIPAARNASVLVLVATVFNFIRWLYYLIYDAMYVIPEPITILVRPGRYILIVDAIFNYWFFLVVLGLLYGMASQRAGGLWSTAQPWTAAVPMSQAQYGQPQYGQQQYQYQPQPGYQYGPPMQPHENGFSNGSPPPPQQVHMQQSQPYVPQPGPYQPPTQPHVTS